jgi:hypothetical protein
VNPIKRDLVAALHRKKLDDDSLAEFILAGLVANDLVYYQGEPVGEAPNWAARIQTINTCVKVRGDEAPKRIEHSGHLSLEAVRHEQGRLEETLEWLE